MTLAGALAFFAKQPISPEYFGKLVFLDRVRLEVSRMLLTQFVNTKRERSRQLHGLGFMFARQSVRDAAQPAALGQSVVAVRLGVPEEQGVALWTHTECEPLEVH